MLKKIIYIIAFSLLGILMAFLIHAVIEFAVVALLLRNFTKYSLGFSWQQWFTVHQVVTVVLLLAGGLFGLSQGFLWWRILYVEKRRFGHHRQAIVLIFDGVLFNATDYAAGLKNYFFSQLGIAPELFIFHWNAVRHGEEVGNLNQFVIRFANTDKKVLHQTYVDFVEHHARNFLTADAEAFVNHHRTRFDIIVLASGDEALQTSKLEHSGLSSAVKMLVSDRSPAVISATLADQYQAVHFIDRQPAVVSQVKKVSPTIITYLVDTSANQDAAAGVDHIVQGLDFVIESTS